jgi:HEPN domain-containing protein
MFTTPEEDLAQILASPQYWMDKAKALRASAAAIWYWMDSDPPLDLSSALATDPPILNTGTWYVYRMLCGMSLELAYKASLVAMGQKIKATHDLKVLAEQVFPNLSREERGILELLTQCIVWDGRYPGPKDPLSLEYFVYLSYENLYRKEHTENVTTLKPIEPDPLSWENYNALWQRAVAAYEWHS